LSLAAAAALAASRTNSPSLKFATRVRRARSGGKKPSTSPRSARKSRVLETRDCSSASTERMRSILGSGTVVREGLGADYPGLRWYGQGEVAEPHLASLRRDRFARHGAALRGDGGSLLADAALCVGDPRARPAAPGALRAGSRGRARPRLRAAEPERDGGQARRDAGAAHAPRRA